MVKQGCNSSVTDIEKISGVVCVGACGVCMCGVGECVEGGGGSIVAQF